MRIGKSIATVIALGAVGAGLLVPTFATAKTYTYCGTVDTVSNRCGPQNLWGAVWDKPKYGRTDYKLCVKPPAAARTATGTTPAAGDMTQSSFTAATGRRGSM
jgi:hypothetical protein